MGFVGEWSEFRLICWIFNEFFADGQESEIIMYSGSINGVNFASFTGFWGELCEICIICWKFFAKRQNVNLENFACKFKNKEQMCTVKPYYI